MENIAGRLALPLIFLFYSISGSLRADAAAFNPEPHLKFGFDMEFMPRNFAPLVDFMDLDYLAEAIRKENVREALLSERLTKDYLLNPKALDALSPSLRGQLTQGLNLLEKRGPLKAAPQILDAQGRPHSGSRLIQPDESSRSRTFLQRETLIRPEGLRVRGARENDAIAEIKNQTQDHLRSDWTLLNARWNNLPYEQRAAAVDIRFLTPVKIAELVSRWPLDFYEVKIKTLDFFIRWKTTAPAFLRRLIFTLDVGNTFESANGEGQRVIEAALDAPAPPEEGLSISNQLLRSTYTRALLDDPLGQTRMDISYHLHLGLDQDAPEELVRHLRSAMEQYNKLLLFRLLAAGPQNDSVLDPDQLNSFKPYLRKGQYGLVRVVDERHFEIRELSGQPEAVLAEITEYLREGNSALLRMENEMKRLVKEDASILARIKTQVPHLLFGFPELVGSEEILAANLEKLRKAEPKAQHSKGAEHPSLRRLEEALTLHNTFENFLILVEMREALPQWAHALGSFDMLWTFTLDEEVLDAMEDFARASPQRVWPVLSETLTLARKNVAYETGGSLLSPEEIRRLEDKGQRRSARRIIGQGLSTCLRILGR